MKIIDSDRRLFWKMLFESFLLCSIICIYLFDFVVNLKLIAAILISTIISTVIIYALYLYVAKPLFVKWGWLQNRN